MGVRLQFFEMNRIQCFRSTKINTSERVCVFRQRQSQVHGVQAIVVLKAVRRQAKRGLHSHGLASFGITFVTDTLWQRLAGVLRPLARQHVATSSCRATLHRCQPPRVHIHTDTQWLGISSCEGIIRRASKLTSFIEGGRDSKRSLEENQSL